ncbi:MAG: nucleotidyltransferase family protein [Holophagae bacterium]|nr:nucleotidyltransferase family protein [Holophagae bacterium]
MSSLDRIDPATRWILARAFLPVELPVEPPNDPADLLRTAQRLRLAPRVASRCGADLLTRELGAATAEWFLAASRQATMQALRTEALVRHLSFAASEEGLRFVLLKGGALHLRRIVSAGARPMYDLDILLSRRSARCLDKILRSQGWHRTTSRRIDYHLPPLCHSGWPLLEIHDYLPWVALNGRIWSTFEQLESAKLLEPLPAPLDNVLTPQRSVLASHAAVAAPYVSVFGFADLVELARAGKSENRPASPVGVWLRPTISRMQFARLEALLAGWRALDNGQPTTGDAAEPWLRALATIEGTPVGAPRTMLRPLPGSPHPWLGVAQRLTSRLIVTRHELALRYGRPRRGWQYAALQARRWFEIAARELRLSGGSTSRGVSIG